MPGARNKEFGGVLAAAMVLIGGRAAAQGDVAPAADLRYDIGLHAGLAAFDARHAELARHVATYVRRAVSGPWYATLSLDSYLFELQGVPALLGIQAAGDDEASEAGGAITLLTPSLGYAFTLPWPSVRPYAQAGIGLGFATAEDVRGVGLDGAAFDIDVEADERPQFVPTVSVGCRCLAGRRWFVETGLRFDYHVVGWTATDRVSGRSIEIEDFAAQAAYLGFGRTL